MAFRIVELAGRLVLALGFGCLLLAVYLSWLTLSFQRDAARVDGEVVSYRDVNDSGSIRYVPRVRYKTAAGEIVTIDVQVSMTSRRFTLGETVPIDYKVAKPTDARVALFMDNWLGPLISVVIGLAGVAGGFLVRRSIRREIAKSRP